MSKEILLTKEPDDIFYSPSGEGIHLGVPKVFIRTQICPFTCHFCFGLGDEIPEISLWDKTKKKLDEVMVGDELLTYHNFHGHVKTKVEQRLKRSVPEWLEIIIDGKLYEVTHDHPFFTAKGKTKASELIVGSEVLSNAPNNKIVQSIREKEGELAVYNLSCAPYNTYLIDDMWVHNCDSESTWKKKDGVIRSFDHIVEKIKALGKGYFKPDTVVEFELTGGEIMAQIQPAKDLINHLKSIWPNSKFTLQTSGGIYNEKAQSLLDMTDHVSFDHKDIYQNIPFKIPLDKIRECDEVKLLISDQATYEYTRDYIRNNPIKGRYVVTCITNNQKPESMREDHLSELKTYVEAALADPEFDTTNVQFFPRFHSLLWATKKGV